MNNVELAELFIEADKQGFLGNINDTGACNDKCATCPAQPACEQMANLDGRTNYAHFQELYYTEVLPIMKELKRGN